MTYTINIDKFYEQFCKEYDFLYEHRDNVAGFTEAVSAFDDALVNNQNFGRFVNEFNDYRSAKLGYRDMISSDREAGAFMFALITFE